jgi:hypothetical protein
MIEAGRDTIWAFVLKNIYKPLFLQEHFDLVVGNPPWLSYRHIERSDYQRFLKDQAVSEYGLLEGRGELVTHLELATLFLVRTADLYLRNRGTVAFVLPKSIFSGDQHDALRRGRIKKVSLSARELWDLEGVSPLFNTSSAVYFGAKMKKKLKSVPGELLEGTLQRRNSDLKSAEEALASTETEFNLSRMGKRSFWSSEDAVDFMESPYRKRFRQGATIVPRCFWFVQLKKSDLGFNPELPPLISSDRARKEAKKPYRDCIIEGPVESRFIQATLLPVDMVPFGVLRLRTVILPVLLGNGRLRLLSSSLLNSKGFLRAGRWMAKAEAEWLDRRSTKASKMTLLERLDYSRGITGQNPSAKYRITYATSGTHVCACTLMTKQVRRLVESALKPRFLVVDHKAYYFETDSESEAFYLSSILNAPAVNKAIKAGQSKGLWGARDIHKKVLDLPIPEFDPESQDHRRLAELGILCSRRVRKWIESGGPGNTRSIGVLRRGVRNILSEELFEIDSVVKPMLGI